MRSYLHLSWETDTDLTREMGTAAKMAVTRWHKADAKRRGEWDSLWEEMEGGVENGEDRVATYDDGYGYGGLVAREAALPP